jgi:uncharacterized protein YbaR (Trm112 family)
MPIPQELLAILACAICKTPLTLSQRQDSLICSQCHRAYPIRDGLPILLPDEATIEDV